MNILAIGSHPDDIEYGCGGTLLKFSKKSYKIFLLIMSDGSFGGNPEVRKKEQNISCKTLKAKLFWAGFEDTKIVVDAYSIGKIEEVIKITKPDLIFTHYHNDTHQDHRHVSQASMTATRHFRNVLFYEVPTTVDFTPGIFADITTTINGKMKLLRTHKSQIYETRVPSLSIIESAKSCAIFRGFQNRVKHAEGFSPLRFSFKF